MDSVDLRGEEMIPQPNCSEAVYRIRVDKITEKEREIIKDIIKQLEELDREDWNVNNGTYWRESEIFGIKIIEIYGQYPYDRSYYLDKIFKSLPFADRIKCETDLI